MSAPIKVDRLVKRFGGLTATDNIDFVVEEGQSVGLIGPNGAGKTTIFSLIMGEHLQSSGTIYIYGAEISRLPTAERIRHGVSRTYQVPKPFGGLTVMENIRVGMMPDNIWQMITRGPNPDREIELALSVGLSQDDLYRRPSELSLGNMRKLEMARTLATNPKIMLLDEVFAGLAAGEIAQISSLVQQLRKQGMTFLIVSHDLKALEPLIDKALAINQGRKIAEGTFQEVMTNDIVRASYLGEA